MAVEIINQSSFRLSSMSKEVEVNNTTLKPSKSKEVTRQIETIEQDNDFRDFIKSDISMDELFKRKEIKDELSNN